MSVFTRMLLVYLVVVIVVALFGLAAYTFIVSNMEENLYQNLSATSTRMTQQLDSLIRPMEYTSLHLLSNRHFLNAMEDLAGIDREKGANRALISLASNEIYSQMMSYSLYKNFYRVSVFNSKKDFFSSNYTYLMDPPPDGYGAVIDSLEHLELLRDYAGRIAILPPVSDPWDSVDPQKVFTVSRSIRSDPDMGFVEVQQLYSELEGIFALGEAGGTAVCALTRENQVLYDGGLGDEQLAYYRELAVNADLVNGGHFEPHVNALSGESEVLAATTSAYTGVTVLLIQNQKQLLQPLTQLGRQMLILYIVVVSFSCLFFLFQSRSMVAPLRQLKREMEITRLENLPKSGEITASNNEITSLNQAFNDLKERLGELIQQELDLQTLHMQASFDALQAQVNPHFIYNTLGLISNRAALQGDEEICNICGSIASMLRYSVNTKTRIVTLREELEHLDDYVFLMKERYEHRLEFHREVESDILGVLLPKMVLQPLVENTINHGFNNREDTIYISITGGRRDERWELEILDNGQGFTEEALAGIREKCDKIKGNRHLLQENGGELGGLGIVNIYARLLLLSGGKVSIELGNAPGGGARIVLSGPIG